MVAGEVAVVGADGEGGCDGDVGESVVGERAPDEGGAGVAVAHGGPHIQMEDGTAGVFGLQVVLFGQRVKGIRGVGDGELGGVGVIRLVGGSGVDDSGVAGDVLPGEPVGGTFGGACVRGCPRRAVRT